MREKPLLVPSRSRKLLPRLVTVAPAETVELIMVGVGLGIGVGVGDGDGVGVGVAVGVGVGEAVDVGDGDGDCACADVTTPNASTKPMASSRANARPAPIPSARDAQRMNSIPEKAPARKMRDKPIGRFGFAPSSSAASIGCGPHQGLNTAHCGSAATGGLSYPELVSSKAGQIRVPSGEACPEILQISPSSRTLPLASSRSASG